MPRWRRGLPNWPSASPILRSPKIRATRMRKLRGATLFMRWDSAIWPERHIEPPSRSTRPRSADKWGLGRTLVQSDPRAAEAAFLAALSYEPDNVIALNNLGVSRDMQRRNAEAQDAYRHALTVSPESTDVQVNLGMSLALSGHAGEAVPLLRGIAARSRRSPGVAKGTCRSVEPGGRCTMGASDARHGLCSAGYERHRRGRSRPRRQCWQRRIGMA